MNDAILIMIEETMMKHFMPWTYKVKLTKKGYRIIMVNVGSVHYARNIINGLNLNKTITVTT